MAQVPQDSASGDFAALFRALLPHARGFVCHDGRGRAFWVEAPPGGMPELGTQYQAGLRALLAGEAPPADATRLRAGEYCAFLVPLQGDAPQLRGVLTLFTDKAAAGMGHAELSAQLAPALRSLQRELALRLRVLDSQQKLQVQAAEERLLHKVESLFHERQDCDAALTEVLELCRGQLGVAGGFIVLPDKALQRVCGDALSEREVGLLVEELQAAATSAPQPGAVNRRGDLLWLPIGQGGQERPGIFALCGLQGSPFSERRLARVARYLVSQIGSLLERHYDPVTGLMAWPLLEREIAAAAAAPDADEHVVMSCDIDQLHVVNDTFGRPAGDDVLRRFGALLRAVLPGKPASRVTGDNFAVLLTNTDVEHARALAEEICARFRENVYQDGDRTHRPGVSIGIGPLADGGEAHGGLTAAQVACKAARDRGGGRVEVYEQADASIVRRLDDIQLVGYVRTAIETNRLALVAQRLMPLRQGCVANYHEVLVRIVDDGGEHVPPGDFMSAAERYQLMEEMDRWVVRSALELLARHGRHLRGADARFAINLSGQSLGSDAFLPFVEDAIRRSGVAPDLLTFEITESLAVAKMQQAQNFMHALRKLGCRFSLDDFGTGLSSFAYLKLFPVDTLKIDGSFVRDLTSNVVSQSVVAAIAEVARVMKLDTVAEYVQDQAALDLLRRLNISYAQGYFIGCPEPLEQVIAGAAPAGLSAQPRRGPAGG